MAQALQAPQEIDAAIIGAGPVGLFQVFELGLLEIKAHVIDALPIVGGQPAELYPDKPIYDIPGIPMCSGLGLIEALQQQIAPFAPTFHLGHEVSTLQPQPDGRFLLESAQGLKLLAKAVFIAAGVGAFQPRRLTVPGIEAFEGRQLFYRVPSAAQFAGQQLVIVGGGDSALDWAAHFASQAEHRPASVVLLHRRDGFQATPAAVARMRALCEAQQMQFMVGQVAGFEADDDRLRAVRVMGPDGVTRTLAADALLAFLGMSPKLGPIADWQIDIERKQLLVNTETYGTSVPGIFAVGDINTYPGKKKLILCGFHEATLAAYGALPFVYPGKDVFFQYTTTSPRLHAMLGVATPEKKG
ncbi:NAD(P)/FAD-dependent oxidoreductase [Ottowia oryzae]|uniref:Ferredoxin--NADP reductase n=1 Tax=Ottowia oryzae TaxID=2109914 RepID=A0A2S0MGM3_9BURK|nr:NAD(P)/FAD-dependent oxidoreductase [Ottowia oryzae]AVO35045.1 ferredoxin--NADP(+) reductase [Ottowia oryzae]